MYGWCVFDPLLFSYFLSFLKVYYNNRRETVLFLGDFRSQIYDPAGEVVDRFGR
jgi:hypothetical protein